MFVRTKKGRLLLVEEVDGFFHSEYEVLEETMDVSLLSDVKLAG